MKLSEGFGGSTCPPALMSEVSDIPPPLAALCGALSSSGIEYFGGFRIEPGDIPAENSRDLEGMPALLFGNAGADMWARFSRSAEYQDGQPDPLNRWTIRVVGDATQAAGQGVYALFPFGEPVWPFQRWALRAMGIGASPLGMLIHPEFGLWFALRAAVIVPDAADEVEKLIQVAEKMIHPCDLCAGKPCLNACPVDAFSGGGFDSRACHSHLASGSPPDCMSEGCMARDACPVGAEWRYSDEQVRFHMRAFGG